MSRVSALGYLVVSGPAEAWRELAVRVLGAQPVVDDRSGRVRLRTDERVWRIEVQDGQPQPDPLIAIGFEAAGDEAFEETVAALTARRISVTEDGELAEARGVRWLAGFDDPQGNHLELFVGAQRAETPFESPRGVEFVCGALGLGHIFLFAEDGPALVRFYQEALGFQLSDTVEFGEEEATFLHCNPRHHSIAIATTFGPPPGIGHLMLEVDSLTSVGRALDAVNSGDFSLMLALGEHANDRMTSFYVRTPSGFAIEYGWNGRLVDDADWQVHHYQGPSVWGHSRQGASS